MRRAARALPLLLALAAGSARAGGPAHGSGERGAAWLPTASLAFGVAGWAGLITALLRLRTVPRPPAPRPGAPSPLAPGLHPAPAPRALAAACAGHRLLVVGPLPPELDTVSMPSGTVFSLGEGPVSQAALLEARDALIDRGPPLLVLVNAPILGLDGQPTTDLGLFALRRLRLPVLQGGAVHTPSQSDGPSSADRCQAPTVGP